MSKARYWLLAFALLGANAHAVLPKPTDIVIEAGRALGADTKVNELCLNGVVYYIVYVHGGVSLAPKHLPLRHYTGDFVRDKNGKVVINSSPEGCVDKP